jgi:hypothetical protein
MARNIGTNIVSATGKRAESKRKSNAMQRRSFLVALGAGGAVAVAATIKSVVPVASSVTPAATANDSLGYQESDHVRNYYRTAKI